MPRRISTVRGREFGAGVRAALDRTGMSHRAVAKLLGWDHQKLSDLLHGKGGVTEVELSRLLGVSRTPPEECAHLHELFRVALEKGWWQLHDGTLPIQVRTLIEHEDAATELIFWSLSMIPGLLQTPAYTRALTSIWPTVPTGEVEPRVAARLARQEILERRRLFTFLIHENVLRALPATDQMMADQLHHLLRISVRPYITLRVVPIAIGLHAGLVGSFQLMKFAKIPPVVYIESMNSGLFLEDKGSVDIHTKLLQSLDGVALDGEQSRRWITDIVA